MNKEGIKKKIKELEKTSGTNKGWHQRINLGGVWTTDKLVTTDQLFLNIHQELIRESIEDKFILDIGCNAGLFCKKAADIGAFAFGVESKPEWLKQAYFVKEFFRGEYTILDGFVDELELGQDWDYVFAISVLRYIGVQKHGFKMRSQLARHQVGFIQKLAKNTKNFIIKCGLDQYDNIEYWTGVMMSCGFKYFHSIIAYPDVPRARQDRVIVRFTKI